MVDEKTLTSEEINKIRKLLALGRTQRAIHRETGFSRRQIAKVAAPDDANDENPFEYKLQRTTKNEAAKAVYALSVRPQGVKNSELSTILAAHFGFRRNEDNGITELDMSDAQLSYLKKKARSLHTHSHPPLFVPEWMPRETPVEAFKTLLGYASNLQDRINENVSEFCGSYPYSSPLRIYEELICLAIRQATKEPVERRCERNMTAASELQSRLVMTPKSLTIETPAFVPDDEYDALCT